MYQPDLQRILDHFHVGTIQKSVWADFGWMTNTIQGNYLIIDFGTPSQWYQTRAKLEHMVDRKYRQTTLLMLPDLKGDINRSLIHQQGHYFSVFQIHKPY